MCEVHISNKVYKFKNYCSLKDNTIKCLKSGNDTWKCYIYYGNKKGMFYTICYIPYYMYVYMWYKENIPCIRDITKSMHYDNIKRKDINKFTNISYTKAKWKVCNLLNRNDLMTKIEHIYEYSDIVIIINSDRVINFYNMIDSYEIKKIHMRQSYDNIYITHNNGGRPFKVIVFKKIIYIYNNYEPFNLVATIYNYLHIFIKYDSMNRYEYDNERQQYNKFSLGCNILIAINDHIYIHINHKCIYLYTIKHKILSYYPECGGSDVIYPYGITKKFIYLLIDDSYIPKKIYNLNTNIYDYYWNDLHKKGGVYNDMNCQSLLELC